jgi:glycosyltransferase involved in cell wall biosynthesis
MAGELVSVVIPTYNYGRFVPEAVASALAQGYPQVEVIVVDDGSTDDTCERVAPFRDRIRYLYQENRGLSAARNAGIRAARGEIIALLDADDVWHPQKLDVQMRCLAEHPEIDLLASELFTDRRDCWPAVGNPFRLKVLPLALDDLVYRSRFAPSSTLIRKAALEAAGLFDVGLRCVEDRDLWIRFAARFRVAKLLLPLLWYRVHPLSLSAAAARMEEHERRVLLRAFTEVEALRGRPLFWRKARGYAAFNAAHAYRDAGRWLPAAARILRSFLLWPLPFGRGDAEVSCARVRLLVVLLLRVLGLFPLDPGPGSSAPPTRQTVVPDTPA